MKTPDSKFSFILVGIFILGLNGFISCGQAVENNQVSKEEYIEQINRWHQEERIQSLKEEDSWLSLAGLYELKDGVNTFGADSSNDIVFPSDKAPANIGAFTLENGSITIRINSRAKVRHEGNPVKEMALKSDADGSPDVLTYNSLQWYIIERRGTYYVRLKDTEHPNFSSFDGIDRYPVSPEWRIKATFKEYDQPQTIAIPDILGDVYQDTLYGILSFDIDGESYELAPLGSPDGDRFFIIFGDQTNGDETYGGGRYVYIDTPDEDNTTYIDFNKAYNPPCVFTDYATCPLPPTQNKLPLAVTAGEKVYGNKNFKLQSD